MKSRIDMYGLIITQIAETIVADSDVGREMGLRIFQTTLSALEWAVMDGLQSESK